MAAEKPRIPPVIFNAIRKTLTTIPTQVTRSPDRCLLSESVAGEDSIDGEDITIILCGKLC